MSRQRSMEKLLASEYVSIGELARLTGCRYSTLKYYTEEGMLPFEQAEEKLTRRYRRVSSIERVASIKQLRESGKTVPEVKAELNYLPTESYSSQISSDGGAVASETATIAAQATMKAGRSS